MTKQEIFARVLHKCAGLSDDPAVGTAVGVGIGAGTRMLNNLATIGTRVGANGTRPIFTGVGRAAGKGAALGFVATAVMRALNLAHMREMKRAGLSEQTGIE